MQFNREENYTNMPSAVRKDLRQSSSGCRAEWSPHFRTLSQLVAASQFKPILLDSGKSALEQPIFAEAQPLPRHIQRIRSQEEVNENALGDFCNSVGTVAGWLGVELHDGWFHPLAAGSGDHRTGH